MSETDLAYHVRACYAMPDTEIQREMTGSMGGSRQTEALLRSPHRYSPAPHNQTQENAVLLTIARIHCAMSGIVIRIHYVMSGTGIWIHNTRAGIYVRLRYAVLTYGFTMRCPVLTFCLLCDVRYADSKASSLATPFSQQQSQEKRELSYEMRGTDLGIWLPRSSDRGGGPEP
eukprot:2835409-Rhodomonas_salina.2